MDNVKNNRLRAFDTLQLLKRDNTPRKECIDKIQEKFGIPRETIYDWYRNRMPWGRKGKIIHKPDLFYVLGALLGDGCLYTPYKNQIV